MDQGRDVSRPRIFCNALQLTFTKTLTGGSKYYTYFKDEEIETEVKATIFKGVHSCLRLFLDTQLY